MNKILQFSLLWGVLLGFILILSSCYPDRHNITDDQTVADFGSEASLRWNEMFLEIERYAAGYRPGPAPRALAHLGLAAYEACISSMPDHNSLQPLFPGLDLPQADPELVYHWPSVIHGVYSQMIPRFFPSPHESVIYNLNQLIIDLDSKYGAEAGQEVFNRSKSYGEQVGTSMWEWSATDPYGHDAYKNPFGNHTTTETYDWRVNYRKAGDWEPTYPGPGRPMGPFFGRVRTFGLKENQKLALPPSTYFMEYSENQNSEYYSQALQTYTKNALADYNVKWIGEFWSDDLLEVTFSPGPRWIAIANQVIQKEQPNLAVTLETYAKIGLALNDAAVGCWYSKYAFNVERPATYIRKFIDPNYKSNLNNPLTGETGITPSFPAYPSGHSTMGAAAAEALASVFGYNYQMTDHCHANRHEFAGRPRSFTSFEQMAEENAWSRILLGVHWRMDGDEGIRFGKEIGQIINRLPWKN